MKRWVVRLVFLGLLWPFCAGVAAERPAWISAPASPSSVPIVLAAREVPGLVLKWFDNHSTAHALFLRGDVQILSTGLSVGVRFFRQGMPVRMIGSTVSGLTFLIADAPVRNFRDLCGRTLVLPFEGSPIEEVTRFLMEQEGLVWGRDIPIAYAPFPATVNRVRQGTVHAAALPEPYVSQLAVAGACRIVLDYADLWDRRTGTAFGYPQVGLFVHENWAKEHPELLRRFMDALARAVARVTQNPAAAAGETAAELPFPPEVLKNALARMRFRMLRQAQLRETVTGYYQTIGHPLDASFDRFFIAD